MALTAVAALRSAIRWPMASDPPSARLASVKAGRSQMLGVNLGSWLVLEGWMVPDLWSHVLTSGAAPYGERQLMLAAAKQGAGDRMRQAVIAHRGAWVTERDFAM